MPLLWSLLPIAKIDLDFAYVLDNLFKVICFWRRDGEARIGIVIEVGRELTHNLAAHRFNQYVLLLVHPSFWEDALPRRQVELDCIGPAPSGRSHKRTIRAATPVCVQSAAMFCRRCVVLQSATN